MPAVAIPAAVWPGSADEAGLGAGGSFAVEPDRRNARAGEDRELGGGSGISHANAAGDRVGGSADAGGTLDDRRPEGTSVR